MILVEQGSFEEDVLELAIEPTSHQCVQLLLGYVLKVNCSFILFLTAILQLNSIELCYELLLKSDQLLRATVQVALLDFA